MLRCKRHHFTNQLSHFAPSRPHLTCWRTQQLCTLQCSCWACFLSFKLIFHWVEEFLVHTAERRGSEHKARALQRREGSTTNVTTRGELLSMLIQSVLHSRKISAKSLYSPGWCLNEAWSDAPILADWNIRGHRRCSHLPKTPEQGAPESGETNFSIRDQSY